MFNQVFLDSSFSKTCLLYARKQTDPSIAVNPCFD